MRFWRGEEDRRNGEPPHESERTRTRSHNGRPGERSRQPSRVAGSPNRGSAAATKRNGKPTTRRTQDTLTVNFENPKKTAHRKRQHRSRREPNFSREVQMKCQSGDLSLNGVAIHCIRGAINTFRSRYDRRRRYHLCSRCSKVAERVRSLERVKR